MATSNLGFGLGFRPQQAREIMTSGGNVDWFEIVTENFLGVGGRPDRVLTNLMARYPVTMHGVGLSIASTDPINERYLGALAALAERCEPVFVSDHLCWTNHRGRNSHDLLPVAYTEDVLAHVAARVGQVQDRLGRRIYLENPSAYVQFAASEMDEAEFLTELSRRSGCGILLDVNNLYVNAMNLGMDVESYLARLSRDQLCYMHLAGHSVLEDVRIDTHDHHVPDGVWAVYAAAVRRFPDLPSLVEWDDHLPEYAGLVAELDKARQHHAAALLHHAQVEGRRAPAGRCPTPAVRAGHDESVAWQTLQDTFWNAITTLKEETPAPPAGLLTQDQPVTAQRGLSVYGDAYFYRLLGVLKDAFPALAKVMGDGRFADAMRGYLAVHAPTEISVKYAGQHLPVFMAAYDASALGVDATVLADLAALEWARYDLFDAEDSPAPLAVGVLQQLAPADWEGVRFDVIAAVRVVPVTYDVGAVIDAVAEGRDPERPVEQPGSYIVTRAAEDVSHQWFAAAPAAAFREIQAGRGFGASAAAALATVDADADHAVVLQGLVGSLAGWLDQGLICGFNVPETSTEA